ncbi:MAG: hypothetical protein ABIJ10_00335 [Candidatus Micrarchaeota archaeon]
MDVRDTVAENLIRRLLSGQHPAKLKLSRFDKSLLVEAVATHNLPIEIRVLLGQFNIPINLAPSDIITADRSVIESVLHFCDKSILGEIMFRIDAPPFAIARALDILIPRSKEVDDGYYETHEEELMDGRYLPTGRYETYQTWVPRTAHVYGEVDINTAYSIISTHPQASQVTLLSELNKLNPELARLIVEKHPSLRGPYR